MTKDNEEDAQYAHRGDGKSSVGTLSQWRETAADAAPWIATTLLRGGGRGGGGGWSQTMISPHNNDHRIVLYHNTQFQPRKTTYQKSRREIVTRSVCSGFFDISKN